MKVTLLNGLYKAQKGHISIPALMNQIKTGVYAQAVFEVRKTLALNGKRSIKKQNYNCLALLHLDVSHKPIN
ncbi:hypothetical protein [Aureispira anguillae]|uniref:Uncharacterized protein n=1 Tax=Aureispira anguillae TaxID=2864201 RepID=A0A915VK97_9BACT|nr:hypothetical protein [Aureispira anguillae]BDS09591.1 hypothetical protein AsAng_0002950 [Aureispira anguillae]